MCAITVSVLTGIGLTTGTANADPAGLTMTSPRHGTVVIRRTDYGVPHILAGDFPDLGYGYGYAFAQDNLCELADQVVTVDGERSRYFGPDADSGDQLSGPLTNLDSDVFHRWVDDSGMVERAMDQPAPLGMSPQVRGLVDGYVAGVNRYLADTGVAHLPDPTCRAKPWVHPITDIEIERIFYAANQLGGIGSVADLIAEAHPAADPTTRMPDLNPADLGSNAIGVGRTGTAHGDGLLLANPHFPWLGAGRFYQVQLTIPGVLDVTGASLYGTPVVEIGHTAGLAWSHTVSTAQRFTLYQLRLVPGDPTSYVVDGHVERMTSHRVAVPVSGGGTVSRTVYDSRYGPVLALDWTATTAVAMRGVNVDNGRSLNEWLGMDQAQSVPQLRAVQNRYQGIPFTNTIAADSAGTAYFADASVVPHVTDAQLGRCVDSPLGQALYPEQLVLDGSTSDCDWGSASDAITPGIFGPGTDPTLTRTDFVTNSNDSFWLTNPAAEITDEPVIYGDVGTERSLRTRMGLSLIDRRLHGTDGLGAPGFTVPTMQQALLSDRNLSAELARNATVALCRANPTLTATDGRAIDVRPACPVLAAWNTRDDLHSGGAVLWREYWTSAVMAPDLWRTPFDPAHPATTPNTLNTASPAVRRALADAVERMETLGVPLNASLSTTQYTDVGGPDVALPGCGNAEGCYSVVEGNGSPGLGDGRFTPVRFGSSFVMVAEMSPHGPVARTILTYSESTNPTSPHHDDQTKLFAAQRWVTDRFTEHDIRSDPHLTITVLTRP
jgi:acyl-homoserine-lactone acylase